MILNGVHPTATIQATEARAMVEKLFGLECLPAHLSQRAAYAEAPTTGNAP